KNRLLGSYCLATILLFPASASAHFPMLLPAAASAKRGEPIAFVYQWGHPFEHQLFNAPTPQAVLTISPEGKKTDLANMLEAISTPTCAQKEVSAARLRFTPAERGDYVFALDCPPVWMEEDQEFLHDSVKVILHVQAQRGWDRSTGQSFELLPLTRPYGLQPG